MGGGGAEGRDLGVVDINGKEKNNRWGGGESL